MSWYIIVFGSKIVEKYVVQATCMEEADCLFHLIRSGEPDNKKLFIFYKVYAVDLSLYNKQIISGITFYSRKIIL